MIDVAGPVRFVIEGDDLTARGGRLDAWRRVGERTGLDSAADGMIG